MLTGDSPSAAEPIARQAGISEMEAGLDPAAKLANHHFALQGVLDRLGVAEPTPAASVAVAGL